MYGSRDQFCPQQLVVRVILIVGLKLKRVRVATNGECEHGQTFSEGASTFSFGKLKKNEHFSDSEQKLTTQVHVYLENGLGSTKSPERLVLSSILLKN